MKWEPIESAPKDVMFVLLWQRGSLPFRGGWEDTEDGGHWVTDGEGFIVHPTHWMPLPDPPKD